MLWEGKKDIRVVREEVIICIFWSFRVIFSPSLCVSLPRHEDWYVIQRSSLARVLYHGLENTMGRHEPFGYFYLVTEE